MKTNKTTQRPVFSRFNTRTMLSLSCLLGLTVADARTPKIFTTTADWNAGDRFNTIGVNDAANGKLQLVDPGQIQTFPTLWPANAAEDTVTKFDTNINKEVGRYRTWFNQGIHGVFSGPAPSRTAVDADGNVYVVNRHFDGRRIFVMKILTSNVGADDRDGNGVIDTAIDVNNNGVVTGAEILPLTDDGGVSAGSPGGIAGDGIPQIQEFHDERIKWVREIPGSEGRLGRSCAIDPAGNIWVGSYSPGAYWKLSSATGAITAGPVAASGTGGGMTPYGAVVDSRGMLWSAGLSTLVGQLNTNTATWVATRNSGRSNYGIALDNARNRVYLGQGAPYTLLSGIDTVTPTFSFPASGTDGAGISTAANGDILVHGSNSSFPNFVNGGAGTSSGSGVGMTRFRPDHSVAWSSSSQPGANDFGQRGIAPDANGDIFTINLDTSNVSKYRGADGAHLGVFPIGTNPYSYSDLSGSTFSVTNPSGTWTEEHADTFRGQKDCIVTLTSAGPGTIKIELAGSNVSGVPGPFVLATPGAVVPGVAGKFITVRVTLTAANQATPMIQDLTLDSCPQIGDFNNDCCVSTADYALMRAAYLTSPRPTDPKWDVNGDGLFDVADLRREVLLYCNPNGAPCPPR